MDNALVPSFVVKKVPSFVNEAVAILKDQGDQVTILPISKQFVLLRYACYLSGQTAIVVPDEIKYYSHLETCEKLHCSSPTLHNYRKRGWIEGKQIGHRVLYTDKAIADALQTISGSKYRPFVLLTPI